MATTFGRISEFDQKLEDWIQYSEQLQFFLTANKIDDEDQKKVILLTVIGQRRTRYLEL